MKIPILLLFLFPFGMIYGQVTEKDKRKANKWAQKFLITDGHVDLPYRLQIKNFQLTKEYLGIPIETSEGDFDYMRSKAGGLDAPFMSIYIPADLMNQKGESPKLANELIEMVSGIVKAHPDKFGAGNSTSEVMKNFKKGLISLPMGMENGSPIEDQISRVAEYHEKGIRYITLTHSKDNLISDSSYDTTGTHGGLSPFGKDVVKEMNRVGIMVDVSHISDNAFYDAMKIVQVPVIASHSSCRAFTPGFERNMSDEMLVELAKNGGVIQINFGSTFIDEDSRNSDDILEQKLRKKLAALNLSMDDEAAKPHIEAFEKENPFLFADVSRVADHIDHVVKIAGIDHVGFGSDYDGVGDTLPTGLKDVSTYPNLLAELIHRGYSKKDIRKICFENVFRVWKATENYAQQF